MLKDKILQNATEELGFSKVALGDNAMIYNLVQIFNFFITHNINFHDMSVSHNNPYDNKGLLVHQKITTAVKPYFDQCFENYAFLASHFVVKKAKSIQSFQIHQDWNVVDETQYYNYQVWIPLGLSYPENGGICFIPESHRFFDNIRSGSLGIPHIPIEKRLHNYLSYLRLFPGEAAVFFSKTFHGSFINSTPENRIAVLVNIVQNKAMPLYFDRRPGDKNVNAYSITSEEIFRLLPRLEKGELPLEKTPEFTIAYTGVDNTTIHADNIIYNIHSYNLRQGRALDYEHKLFHILKDKELEKRVNNDGYAIIDFIDSKAISALQNKFNEMFPERTKYHGAYSGFSHLSLSERKEMYDFIIETIQPHLKNYFEDYYVPGASFYSRKPDKAFPLEWHNDPSLIFNEHIEAIYGIWCPLIDVDESCGTLKVIPKSHRLTNKLHFPYTISHSPIQSNRKLLDKFGISFKLKAGQSILFDGRMIHSSEPNQSNINRDNIIMRICHKNSCFFNVKTETNSDHKGKLFKQDRSFFFSKALVEHASEPTTGEYVGDIYLFNDVKCDENFIKARLNYPQ